MATKRKSQYTKTFMVDGKRYFVRADKKKDLDAKYQAKLQEVLEGQIKKGKDLTLDEYHEQWYESRHGAVKEATLRKQRFQFALLSKIPVNKNGKTLGSMKLPDIETQHIRYVQRYLATQKKGEVFALTGDPDSLARNADSVNGLISFLSHILKDACDERIIDFNPCKPVKPLKRADNETEARDTVHRALTLEETEAFFNASKGTWYYNAYVFMINSGMRCGEVGALRVRDIDFQNKVINISRTVTRGEFGAHIIGETPKTKKSKRTIRLTKPLETAILNQLELNKIAFENIVSINSSSDKDDSYIQKRNAELSELIFKSSENTLLNDTVVNRDIKRKCRNAGIERFSCHAFRDTYATRCIEQGMHPNTLKEVLGHARFTHTMDLYAHTLDNVKADEMDMINVGVG